MRGLLAEPDDSADDDGARPSDRPTLPADVDGLPLGAGGERALAGRQYLAGLPSASAATARRRASDVHALLEAERLLAQTNRSGVRAMALDASSPREVSPSASSVQPPIARALPSPPTIEVTVAMSPMIALTSQDPPTAVNEPPGPKAFPVVRLDDPRLAASRASWVPTAPRLIVADAPSVPRRSPGGVRRFLAGALFAVLMAGALALLATALSRRGLLRIPDVHGLR
jgi:hypothetical protein